jgi:hypothetical protein
MIFQDLTPNIAPVVFVGGMNVDRQDATRDIKGFWHSIWGPND